MCRFGDVSCTIESKHELPGWETNTWFGDGNEVDVLNSKYLGAIPSFLTISYHAKLFLIR